MFGYVTVASSAMTKEQQERYRAYYCGLCHALKQRHGAIGRMTLSYDLTFLYLLLSSLYEPHEAVSAARCVPHPIKPHPLLQNELSDYCCDMNLALAYHKCLDDWQDDRSIMSRAEAGLLKRSYDEVCVRYPDTCREIERCISELTALERAGEPSPDAGANLMARMLGKVYHFRDDLWGDTLVHIGEGLGRFIYVMDAYEDLSADKRRGRYNPLLALSTHPDYEERMKDTLTLLIAESTDAFETLPLVKDMDILRNILYAGCWSRYASIVERRERKRGVPVPRKDGRKSTTPAAEHKEDGA